MNNDALILVVDDDPVIVTAACHLLAGAGYRTLSAYSGKETLELARREHPDLILLDVNLPDADGFSLCRELKADPDTASSFIIIISGTWTDSDSQAEGLLAGADGYMTRPVANRELLARVEAMLRLQRSERALKAANAQWKATFDAIGDAVLLTDNEYTVLKANRAASELFGKRFKEMIGSNCWKLVHGSDGPPAECLLDKVKKNKERVSWEFQRDDRRLELSIDPLIENDRVIGCVHVIRDITERKKAQEALRESERRWAALSEASPVGIFRTDAQGKTIYVNQAWCEISGMSADAALGDDWLMNVHPDDRERLIAEWRKMVKKGVDSKAEYRFVHPDGTIRWVLGHSVPERDERGKVVGYVGAIVDITQRRAMEKALHNLNRLYALLSQVNQAVVRARSAQELFKAVCRCAVEYGGFRMAWVGLLDHESGQVRPAAVHGFGEDYLRTANISLKDPERSRGTFGRALLESRVVVSNDIAADPSMAPWREQALERGYRSAAAVPFRQEGRIIGALALYAAEELAFAEGEVSLLDEIGLDVSFALDRLKSEEERRLAETALRESRQMLRQVLDTIPVRVFWKDTNLNYLGCNRLFALDAGLSEPDELIGKDDYAMGWKDQADLYRADDRAVIQSGTPKLAYEEPQTTPDGRLIWLRTSKTPLRDAAGKIIGVLGTYEDITEEKKLRDELAERERSLRLLYNSMNEGLALHELVYDEAGRAVDYILLDVNPAFEELTGLTREQVIGRRASELYGTGEPPFIEQYAATVEDGPIRFEVYFAPMDKHFAISAFSPAPGRFATIFYDISEQKRMEAALRESEERFRSFVENTSIGVYRTTPDGRILMANPALVAMFGCSSFEELAARNLNHEGFVPQYPRKAFIERLERQGELRGWESAWVRSDGSTIYVRENARVVRDAQGRILYYEGTAEDITEHRAAEQKIREQLAELQRWYEVMLGRESRIMELKKEVNQLLQELGRPPHYQVEGPPQENKETSD